jgi:hypothetical protein
MLFEKRWKQHLHCPQRLKPLSWRFTHCTADCLGDVNGALPGIDKCHAVESPIYRRSPEGKGPASSGKIALFAVAIALVLGAVFYGLDNTSVNQASTEPPAKTAQTTTPIRPRLRAYVT